MHEYLEALDEEALTETLPKRLSQTDPQARGTAIPGGPAFRLLYELPDRYRARCHRGCGTHTCSSNG
ncbi:hypothetical protein EMIT0P253_10239 [Pseudomonas sp. IT-P253]